MFVSLDGGLGSIAEEPVPEAPTARRRRRRRRNNDGRLGDYHRRRHVIRTVVVVVVPIVVVAITIVVDAVDRHVPCSGDPLPCPLGAMVPWRKLRRTRPMAGVSRMLVMFRRSMGDRFRRCGMMLCRRMRSWLCRHVLFAMVHSAFGRGMDGTLVMRRLSAMGWRASARSCHKAACREYRSCDNH